jgi:hypothetical protein
LGHTNAVVLYIFHRHGLSGDVMYADSASKDEVAFVVTSDASANMNEREVTVALTELLRRKVAMFTDSDQWAGRSTWL